MKSSWKKVADSLDAKMGNAISSFVENVLDKEEKNPWNTERRYQNAEENEWMRLRGNVLRLEICNARMLDFLGEHYVGNLCTLEEEELFLLVLCCNFLQIPISPDTRMEINRNVQLDAESSFVTILDMLIKSEVRGEYSKLLMKKFGTFVPEEIEEETVVLFPGISNDTVSEEDRYLRFCNYARDAYFEKDAKLFEKKLLAYIEERVRIRKTYALDNVFLTDRKSCEHFRLSCMFCSEKNEETVALRWKDILKYPSEIEIMLLKRWTEDYPENSKNNTYLTIKDIYQSIWCADYCIMEEIRKAGKENRVLKVSHRNLKKQWNASEKKLSAFLNLSVIQSDYFKFLGGETRTIILNWQSELQRGIERYPEEECVSVIESLCHQLCRERGMVNDCTDPALESDDFTTLWKRRKWPLQLSLSDNGENFFQYFLWKFVKSEEKERAFEENLQNDVNILLRYWLNRGQAIMKKL